MEVVNDMVLNRKAPSGSRRGGFTFIEVLFAVIILGVGLIMIAAMLPVAIKQSDDTLGEITAKATAESGFGFIHAAATKENLPVSGSPAMVWSISTGGNVASGIQASTVPPLLSVNDPQGVIRGNQVNTVDRRFAWVPFYFRDQDSSTATIWCIGVRLRNTEEIAGGTYSVKSWARSFNGPWLVRAWITDSTDGSPDRIRFEQHDPADGSSRYPGAAKPGAFIILNEFLDAASPDKRQATLHPTSDAQLAPRYGRVLKLGARLSQDEFELDPSYDIPMLRGDPYSANDDHILNTPDDVPDFNFHFVDGNPNNSSVDEREVSAWIIGAGRGARVDIDPSSADFDNENDEGLNLTDEGKNPFKGAAQDVLIVAGRIDLQSGE